MSISAGAKYTEPTNKHYFTLVRMAIRVHNLGHWSIFILICTISDHGARAVLVDIILIPSETGLLAAGAGKTEDHGSTFIIQLIYPVQNGQH